MASAKSLEVAKQHVRAWVDTTDAEDDALPLPDAAEDGMEIHEERRMMSFNVFDPNPRTTSTRNSGPGANKRKADSLPPNSPVKSPRKERQPLTAQALNIHQRSFQMPKGGTKPAGKADTSEPVGGGVGLTKKDQELYRKALDAFEKQQAALTSEEIWKNKTRKRQVDAAVKTMTTHCSSMAPLVDKWPAASELSSKIHDWCDDVAARFGVLQGIRSSAFLYVDCKMDSATMEILMLMPMPLLNNIILYCAGEAVKGLDQDSYIVSEQFQFSRKLSKYLNY